MELNSIMNTQLLELQQTVQMSVLQNAMNMETTSAVQLLEQMPEQQAVQLLEQMPEQQAVHPFKGSVIDIQV